MTFYHRDRRAGFEQAYDGVTPPLDWRDGAPFDETLSSDMRARAEHAVLEAELRAGQRDAARRWPRHHHDTDRLFRAMRRRLIDLWDFIRRSDMQTRLGECRGEC